MRNRSIGIIGTLGRFILAPVLIYFGFNSPLEYIANSTSIGLLPGFLDDLLIGIIILPLIMIIGQMLWKAIKNEPLRATGSMELAVNIIITVALFYTPLHHAMWFFLGSSLLVAPIRGYAGCEIMAISNWITGRNDQVGCVLFSPLDAIERKLS